jgi:hypothetical protein
MLFHGLFAGQGEIIAIYGDRNDHSKNASTNSSSLGCVMARVDILGASEPKQLNEADYYEDHDEYPQECVTLHREM